jgi:hypothetical protein
MSPTAERPQTASRAVLLKQRRYSGTGDEHVFLAVVGERLASKAAVERLQVETGDVQQPKWVCR